MRRLGALWRTLHRLVYVAAVLVVLHNLWAAKVLTTGRLAWAALIAGLLVARIPIWVAARRRPALRPPELVRGHGPAVAEEVVGPHKHPVEH